MEKHSNSEEPISEIHIPDYSKYVEIARLVRIQGKPDFPAYFAPVPTSGSLTYVCK